MSCSADVKVVNALSIDVEDYFHATALSQSIPRSTWDATEHHVIANTNRLLNLLSDAETSATFFVLGWVAERYPSLVRDIQRCGHEIACHGYSHKLIHEQSRRQFVEETAKAKEILEHITGERVLGYRGASFSITENTLWALEEIAGLGFEYDSSIYPVYHDCYGIPGAPACIHIRDFNGGQIVEMPPGVLQLGKVRVPMGGGGYFRLFPYPLTRLSISRANSQSIPFIFYTHPWEIDEQQPRAKLPFIKGLRHYGNTSKVYGRLMRLLSEFRFASMWTVLGNFAPSMLQGKRIGRSVA